MFGRLTTVAALLVAALAWMLADRPRPAAKLTPPLASAKANTDMPKTETVPMEAVQLPPPPALAAPAPLKTVTPLATHVETAESSRGVTPLAATKTALAPPESITPLRPSPTTLASEKATNTPPPAVEIAALKPSPQPSRPRHPASQTAKPTPATAPASQQPIPPDSKRAADDGRPLLRLLEHGEGPSVEIAWPASAAERLHLYRVLHQCYGMRIAVMDADGRLFAEDGRPGDAWDINLDWFSGFVRQSSGGAALDEHQTANRIRAHHGIAGAATVRLFPRAADALLLGGLRQLIGDGYGGNARIRARYEVSGWRVGVSRLSVDARPVAGRVDLSGAAQRHCPVS